MDWDGLGMDWAWIGHGLAMDWEWIGHGLGMDWEWIGHGLGMDWEWIGHGLGTYLRLGLDLQGVLQDPDQGVHDLST